MEQHTYEALRKEAREALGDGRLGDALHALEGLAGAGGQWENVSALDEIKEAYGMMLDYMERGSADPGRETMYNDFVRRAGELLDRVERGCELRQARSHYAAVHATLDRLGGTDWTAAARCLVDNAEALAACRRARPADEGSSRVRSLREEHVRLYRTLFEALWTGAPWTAAEAEAAAAFLSAPAPAGADKGLLVSAVTLALLHVFDVRKMTFLLDHSLSACVPVRVRAQVGAVLCYVRHVRRMELYPEVGARFVLLADDASFRAELLTMQLQLLMSLETKKIEKNLREDIIPEMMRGVPGMKPGKSLGLDEATARFSELAANPEWDKNEHLERLERKMHELAEMQARGADVFMGSFSALKQRFPFFEVGANWLYPFDEEHPAVSDVLRGKPFAKLITANDGLCSSDKYSFCLMLSQMPAGMGGAASDQLAEAIRSQGIAPESLPETAVPSPEAERRMYIQDLYRFFKLYRHRPVADDPFRLNLLLTDYAPLRRFLSDDDTLRQLAAFLFREESYVQALPFYEELARRVPEAEWFQKIGYCHHALKDYAAAADAYEKANLLKPDSAWTLGRLATCYRRLGRWADAVACYAGLEAVRPDDTHLLLLAADCLIRLERYDEAFAKLYKADYLDHDSGTALRALAWCSLLTGKNEQAGRYYGQIVAGQPTADDYLNAGHAAWLRGDVVAAVELYRLSLKTAGKPLAPTDFFDADAAVLHRLGKTATDLHLMLDLVNRTPSAG